MHEWSLLLASLCWTQGVRSGYPTQHYFASIIHQRYHVILTQTAIMTYHSEREQCHWGLLQACPLFNFGKGTELHNGSPLPLLFGLHAPRLQTQCPHPSPPAAPTPPLWGSTYCPRFTKLILLTYWLLILMFVVVTVVFVSTFPYAYAICLSLYHSTNSSNKTGPEKSIRHLVRYVQCAKSSAMFMSRRVNSQAPSSS